MSHYSPSRILSARGEIVETFEKEGHKFARIVLKSGCIEVCIDTLEETHLADQVLVDLEFSLQNIQQEDT